MNDEYRAAIVKASSNQTAETKLKLAEAARQRWLDPKYRDTMATVLKARWTPEYKEAWKKTCVANRERRIAAAKRLWQDAGYRSRVISGLKHAITEEARARSSEAARKQWLNLSFRTKMQSVIAYQPKVSKPQELLYSLLDDLEVAYYRERNDGEDDSQCRIGPYHVDCLIERIDSRPLVIEVQGTYWHSQQRNSIRDKAKLTYLTNAGYEVKWVWEHELHEHGRVPDLLRYWLNLPQPTIHYDFSEVVVRSIRSSECKDLLLKYHYLSSAGRHGDCWGAFLENELIAVIVLSKPLRAMMTYDLELSRMCVHPKYRKRNLLTWFMSKIFKNYVGKTVVAYADSSFNHDGAVYRAANFSMVGTIKPDYWYAKDDGWIMHKKTLYSRAVNMKLTEAEFASRFGYHKVYGGNKFKYERKL